MHLRLATAPVWAGRSVALLASLALSIGGCKDDRRHSQPSDAGVHDPDVDAALPPPPSSPADPGTSVTLAVSPSVIDPLLAQLDQARTATASSLSTQHTVAFDNVLGHDPGNAMGLDLIQSSNLALTRAELETFVQNGFAILPSKQYPSFPYGYFDIYGADLPVFVTADMLLEAVHRSFDDIQREVERASLSPRLSRLLVSMRARLAGGAHRLDAAAAADVDFYLTVAQSLLSGRNVAPVTGTLDPNAINTFVQRATEAVGSRSLRIFGTDRQVDFTQFAPTGHYADDETLQRYFRTMSWMRSIDLPLIESGTDGTRTFWRGHLQTALALGALLDATGRDNWRRMDAAISAFAGEHEYITLPDLEALLSGLGKTAAELADIPDQDLAQGLINGEYAAPHIAGQVLRSPTEAAVPISARFAFFGPRYTVDDHVLPNVVYGRVPTRVQPNPLDAAFATFGNDHALSLLSGELTNQAYAAALASTRALVDAHPTEYWQESLYTTWLGALRTLSPRASGGAEGSAASPAAPGLPAVARTEAWARRLLNTELASWAELRHDAVPYTKPVYTVGSECSFPDAYVEPYPEFFHALSRFAELGRSVIGDLGLEEDLEQDNMSLGLRIATYFETLGRISSTLASMAEEQRSGLPHSAEEVAFINQAIRLDLESSGDPWQDGWYKDLFFDPTSGVELDPTIVDVHTDPGGATPVERAPSVLHVGTGLPRAMVVSVDTCDGPRAYVGIVFAYHTQLEPGLARISDEQWQQRLMSDPPADVRRLEPVLAR